MKNEPVCNFKLAFAGWNTSKVSVFPVEALTDTKSSSTNPLFDAENFVTILSSSYFVTSAVLKNNLSTSVLGV